MAKTPKLENSLWMKWRNSPGWRMLLEALGVADEQMQGMTAEDYRDLLRQKVASFQLPIFAQTMIAGPWSSELRSTLPANKTSISRQVIQFEEPVLLLALGWVITGDTWNQPAKVSLDELDVRLDSRQDREFWTARNGEASTVGQNGFLPCSMLDFRAPRYFMRVLAGTDPELGVEYRTRYDAGFGANVIVSCTAIAAPLFSEK